MSDDPASAILGWLQRLAAGQAAPGAAVRTLQTGQDNLRTDLNERMDWLRDAVTALRDHIGGEFQCDRQGTQST